MRPLARASALILASASLLGCDRCLDPLVAATTSTPGGSIKLDAATSQASSLILFYAPGQSCDATLALDVSGQVGGASPPSASPETVVRFTLTPFFTPSFGDTLEPPLPLDVVLTGASPSAAPVLQATHVCSGGDLCYLGYGLTVARVEGAPAGSVEVQWSVGASYPTPPDGPVILTVSP